MMKSLQDISCAAVRDMKAAREMTQSQVCTDTLVAPKTVAVNH
jgi:hypothetical protein